MPIYDFTPSDPRTDAQQLNSPLNIFQPDKPELKMAEIRAEELINISGAPVSLFLKEITNEGEGSKAELWEEDANSIYRAPHFLKAFFKPDLFQAELTRFGIDWPVKAEVTFAREALHRLVGDRMVGIGDIIKLPFGTIPIRERNAPGPMFFQVLNAYDDNFYHYRWLYRKCKVELLPGDKAVMPHDSQDKVIIQ